MLVFNTDNKKQNVVLEAKDLFNATLLTSNASINDLYIAFGEAVDFLRENIEPVEKLDFVYEMAVVKESYDLDTHYQNLQEGLGDFASKIKDWAIKMWNSIRTFFSNVWLKLTNKWEFRARKIKDKDFIAAIQFARSNKDKWDNKSLSCHSMDVDNVLSQGLNILESVDEKSEASDTNDKIKDWMDNISEKETLSGEDLYNRLTQAENFYVKTKFKDKLKEVDKIKLSIGKMLDQFIKDLKAGKQTTSIEKLHGATKSDSTLGGYISNKTTASGVDKETDNNKIYTNRAEVQKALDDAMTKLNDMQDINKKIETNNYELKDIMSEIENTPVEKREPLIIKSKASILKGQKLRSEIKKFNNELLKNLSKIEGDEETKDKQEEIKDKSQDIIDNTSSGPNNVDGIGTNNSEIGDMTTTPEPQQGTRNTGDTTPPKQTEQETTQQVKDFQLVKSELKDIDDNLVRKQKRLEHAKNDNETKTINKEILLLNAAREDKTKELIDIRDKLLEIVKTSNISPQISNRINTEIDNANEIISNISKGSNDDIIDTTIRGDENIKHVSGMKGKRTIPSELYKKVGKILHKYNISENTINEYVSYVNKFLKNKLKKKNEIKEIQNKVMDSVENDVYKKAIYDENSIKKLIKYWSLMHLSDYTSQYEKLKGKNDDDIDKLINQQEYDDIINNSYVSEAVNVEMDINNAKHIIPALAKILYRYVAVFKQIADERWSILEIAATIGKKDISELKKLR